MNSNSSPSITSCRRAATHAMIAAYQGTMPDFQKIAHIKQRAIASLQTIVMPLFNITSLAIDDTIAMLQRDGIYRQRIKQQAAASRREADRLEAMLFGSWEYIGGQDFFLDYLDRWQDEFAHDYQILRYSLQRYILRTASQASKPYNTDHVLQTAYTAVCATMTRICLEAIMESIHDAGLNIVCDYNFTPLARAVDQLVGLLTNGQYLRLERDPDTQLAVDIIVKKAIRDTTAEGVIKQIADDHEQFIDSCAERIRQQDRQVIKRLKSKYKTENHELKIQKL